MTIQKHSGTWKKSINDIKVRYKDFCYANYKGLSRAKENTWVLFLKGRLSRLVVTKDSNFYKTSDESHFRHFDEGFLL